MITALMYDANGNITSVRSGSDKAVLNDVYGDYIITTDDFDYETSYIKGGELKQRPARESQACTWDNESESWAIDLSQYKVMAWQSCRAMRDAKEFAGFTYNGNAYDSNAISQQRIQGAAQLAAMNPAIQIDWTLQDNSSITLDGDSITSLAIEMFTHIASCHAAGRQVRTMINSAQTKEDVDDAIFFASQGFEAN